VRLRPHPYEFHLYYDVWDDEPLAPGSGRGSGVALEELHDPAPGVGGLLGELLLLAVEERVRDALVHDDLVFHTLPLQGLAEGIHDIERDAGVVTGLQAEHRSAHPVHDLDRPDRRSLRVAVEADHAGEPQVLGGHVPGVGSTETEAEREDRAGGVVGAQDVDRCRGVGGDVVDGDLRHMLLPVEALVTTADAGRAPEVVDGHGVVPALGEAHRKLGVEVVKAPDVGKDHHTRALRLRRIRRVGRELVAVAGLEHQVFLPGGSALDPRDGRVGVWRVAHGGETSGRAQPSGMVPDIINLSDGAGPSPSSWRVMWTTG